MSEMVFRIEKDIAIPITSKQKAIHIYNKMGVYANILVSEIIKELEGFGEDDGYTAYRITFWSDVKAELQELSSR